MCGILGGWTAQVLPESIVQNALDAMIHRGPDDSGILQDAPAFLGMRRLAIIDLNTGRQPQFNEDRSVAVVCNGEIYNYKELRTSLSASGHTLRTASDTEVLAHLYEDRGSALCSELRGMYGFAIWDRRNRKLLLGRDRFGKKPIYYTRTPDGGLVFATELKALMPLVAATGGSWELRESAIGDYLSLGCVPQPETAVQNVFAVPAGSVLEFDGRRIEIRKYWEPQFEPKIRLSYPDVLARTRDLVAEATKLRLRADVPLGVFLSSGVDSTVVAYEAARQAGTELHTFTVGVNDPKFDESPVARRTAEYLGVRNTVLPLQVDPLPTLQTLVRQYDQPFADPSAIPSLAICRLARQHVTVVLNGDGGDEVFAGYRRHLAARMAERFGMCPGWLFRAAGSILGRVGGRRSAVGFAARFLRGFGLPPGARHLAWSTDRIVEADKLKYWSPDRDRRVTESWIEQSGPLPSRLLDVQTALDIRVNLLSALLVKMDIASMAFSLEARSPLLDQELADFVCKLPPEQRIRRRQLKSPLRDAYRGLIPDEVIRGAKRGFEIPLAAWLQRDFRELLSDTLGSREARVTEFLDPALIRGLLDRRVLKERNWATIVYELLVLELWLRHFAEQQSQFRGLRDESRSRAAA